MYSSCGLLEDDVLVFDGIENPGLVAWSSMLMVIKACSNLEQLNLGSQLHGLMIKKGFGEGLLKANLSLHEMDYGKVFHSLARKLDVHSDPYVTSALIDMYSKCGMPEAASRVFERVEDPRTVTWSALISGLSWNGWFVEALTCFQKMQFNGIEANEFTLTSVILASVALVNMLINLYSRYIMQQPGAFAYGDANSGLHDQKRSSFASYYGNDLIQIYSDRGQIAEANSVFELMPEKSSSSWTPIISAEVEHGHPSEALALFNDYEEEE
ncbi:hypothetical protein F3Y22_tig00110372pilonHSYRG00041 [Hibiscus syriacus]|uniref:Pentatricopeptide repeat-containing protein n=1 Tax=Hibiscus syriacus TaxID=106335 RepID=A0A6A3AT09_HIBSY|nr:hypothetical protein F3Y22_tig00110372pilonHSYRG00041 [Hibiscus syriacus]